MPGQGRSKYWWGKYHAQIARGKSKEYAAKVASIIEEHHLAKRRNKRRKK